MQHHWVLIVNLVILAAALVLSCYSYHLLNKATEHLDESRRINAESKKILTDMDTESETDPW